MTNLFFIIVKQEKAMRIFYLFVLLMTLLFACREENPFQKREREYHKSLLFFRDSLIQHFPRELGNAGYKTSVLGSTDTVKDFFNMHLLYLYRKYSYNESLLQGYLDQEYAEVHSRVDSLSQVVYDANDSTLLLVFHYLDKIKEKGYVYDFFARRNKNVSKSLPVPLFGDDYNIRETYSGLRDGFKLYVLGAEAGCFLPKCKLGDSSACLPEKWKHGYSRGVALNDQTKEAVFWIIVW